MEAMQETILNAGGPGTAQGWSALWQTGQTVWDLGGATPVLVDEVARAVQAGRLNTGGTACVPGCGAAYDVKALAATFARVVGLDIAQEAVDRAHQVVGATPNAALLCDDFFTSDALPAGSVAFLFDYTFFCAIPPSLRAAWGERTAALLEPGGSLLTLVFPLASDEAAADPGAKGPPHPVSVAEYRRALEPHGVVMVGEPVKSERSVRPELVVWWRKAGA